MAQVEHEKSARETPGVWHPKRRPWPAPRSAMAEPKQDSKAVIATSSTADHPAPLPSKALVAAAPLMPVLPNAQSHTPLRDRESIRQNAGFDAFVGMPQQGI